MKLNQLNNDFQMNNSSDSSSITLWNNLFYSNENSSSLCLTKKPLAFVQPVIRDSCNVYPSMQRRFDLRNSPM